MNAPRYVWKLVRFASKVLRVFAEVETGRIAVAMLDERYAFHVKPGGERRPDDCPQGVRWLDPSQPILVSTSDDAFVPIRFGLGTALPGEYFETGVLIPTLEVFAFSEQFGFQIQAPGATRLCHFRVEGWDVRNRRRYRVLFRGEHHLASLRAKDGDPRCFVYLETDFVCIQDDESAGLALATALEDRHSEVRRLWRASQRAKARDVPAVMQLIEKLRADRPPLMTRTA